MVKIGTMLTLEYDHEQEEIQRFRCRIVEQKGAILYIDYPINTQTGRTDYFPKGTFFSAYFVGKDQAVYKFHTEIVDRKREKVPMLLLRFDQNELKKVQRREYVRVDANLDVAISDPNDEEKEFTTVTKDVSGGGISVILPEGIQIEPTTALDLVIVLCSKDDEIDYIFARAEVIRTYEKTKESKKILSMKFINIYERDRQLMIQYCFETQLKERRQLLSR
ncbi:flagellar brake protein [Amphibacillus sp. Q70]|uniref:flagellar brake protein n=1 Tax=Amphibacillus sp. Q70 TaxID=3453416 RepID=UPI003F8424CC